MKVNAPHVKFTIEGEFHLPRVETIVFVILAIARLYGLI